MAVTVAQAREHLRRREERRQRQADERAARLRQRLPEAARLLREGHGARRVLLFGSLAVGRCAPGSDVDLAVEGLAPERYFEALADLMALFEAPVDLVRTEDAGPSLAARLAAEAVVL